MPNGVDPISEAVFPKTAASYWSIFFQLEIFGVAVLSPLTLAAAWPFMGEAVLFSLIAGAIIAPICLIFAGTQNGYLHRKFGKVDFDGGIVSVFDPFCNRTYSARLADCRWFAGDRTWATVPFRNNLIGIGGGKSLLIVFPKSVRTDEIYSGRAAYAEGPVIVAVGHTFETRLQWESVFERLGLEKDEHRESLYPPVSPEFFLAWFFLVLFSIFIFGHPVLRSIESSLSQWNVPIDIVNGITFALFMPGSVNLCGLLAVVPAYWRTDPDVHQIKRGGSIQWANVIGYGCVLGYFIYVYWSMVGMRGWTENSAMAATVMNVVMGIAVMIVFWCLLAEPRKKD